MSDMRATTAFAYRAARSDGALESGSLDAESRDAASALLTGRGLFPLELRAEPRREIRGRRASAADVALGLRVLGSLLDAGLPMTRALAAMDDLVPATWEESLPGIRDAVREGRGLAAALDSAPIRIPPVVIGMVRAGEAGSGLATAVRRAADLMEMAAATSAALKSALAYPAMLAIAGASAVALLVGVVIPRFAIILADLGQELPRSTRVVLAAAALAKSVALPALIASMLGFAAWRAVVANEAGRARWHGWLLTLPLIGHARLAAATARATAALSALLESGVPLAAALLHAAPASGDAAVARRILAARGAVTTGASIAHALAAEQAMTPTAVRLTRAGEQTGQLAAMLSHASRLEAARAEQLVRGAVRLVEPALIVCFGAIVAGVAAALLQAVYSVRPTP